MSADPIEARERPKRLLSTEPGLVLESPWWDRVLLVQCGGPRYNPEEAAHFRQSLSEHWTLNGTYFMLALRDDLYLWRKETPIGALPDFRASTAPVWHQYLGTRVARTDGPRRCSIEFAMAGWLGYLAAGVRQPSPSSDADQMLVRAGVYEQMKGGTVRVNRKT